MHQLPSWGKPTLQGLAFWVGYQEAYYRDYPLSEGAIVGEACNLIRANLNKEKRLLCEVMFKRLVPSGCKTDWGQKRCDLVIALPKADKVPASQNLAKYVEIVIEVKREKAPNKDIEADLHRLGQYLQDQNKQCRAFLLLVSQRALPSDFVDERSGTASKKEFTIPDSSNTYKVRRVCKASPTFSEKKRASANYACLIEVFS